MNELGGLVDEGDMASHNKLQKQFHKFLESETLRVSESLLWISLINEHVYRWNIKINMNLEVLP